MYGLILGHVLWKDFAQLGDQKALEFLTAITTTAAHKIENLRKLKHISKNNFYKNCLLFPQTFYPLYTNKDNNTGEVLRKAKYIFLSFKCLYLFK